MKTNNINVIKETFQEIADIVTPTMGPKGRMAIISDEMSRPYLTDDGVTVAKECLNYSDPFKKMVATSMIEASNNTEKHAFDGTTLTVLLTNELYKDGLKMIKKKHMHPQLAADEISKEVKEVLKRLDGEKIIIDEANNNTHLVEDVANITTKIPAIGTLVTEAYKHAGKGMNVIIEHDREHPTSSVEHVDGMVIDSGYFTPELRQLCRNEEGIWEAENAKLFLLSEGILTTNNLKNLFASIEDLSTPLVFVMDRNFSPDSLKGLMDNLVNNKLKFMFVFINDSDPKEIFMDIAARTNGKIQSAALGTTDYLYEYAGTASKITVEIDKTTIIASGNKDEINKRLAAYKKELSKNEFTTGYIRADTINRRMSNLDKGLTKIKIATPSITEFRTIRFKLDDAIGAVRCALKEGVLLGGGKALYSLAKDFPNIKTTLQSPLKTIIQNAGLQLPKANVLESKHYGRDARTGLDINLLKAGIIDSYTSITSALINACSIATSYLRAYILINKKHISHIKEICFLFMYLNSLIIHQ